MKKIIIMTCTALTVITSFAQLNSKDEQAVRSIVTTLEQGWNAKNSQTFASVFADKHDYIVVNGLYISNMPKAANAQAHQGLFDGEHKNLNIKLNIDKVQFLRPDLAMIYVIGAGYTKDSAVPADPGLIMSILAEKQKDEWKIISFHNHSIDMENIKRRSAMPLSVAYASWYKK